MTRSGKTSRADAMNASGRKQWTSKDGDGDENLDFADYLFFNPSPAQVKRLLDTLTPAMISEGKASKSFPRRVRLSDSAMGVVIKIGVTISKSRDYWPLNFNASGYAIGEPNLLNMGHPFKIGNAYAEFGKNEKSMYPLIGHDRLASDLEFVTISRPNAKGSAPSASATGSNASPLHNSPSTQETEPQEGQQALVTPSKPPPPKARQASHQPSKPPAKRAKISEEFDKLSPSAQKAFADFVTEQKAAQKVTKKSKFAEDLNPVFPNDRTTAPERKDDPAPKPTSLAGDHTNTSPTPRNTTVTPGDYFGEDTEGKFYVNSQGIRIPLSWVPPSENLQDRNRRPYASGPFTSIDYASPSEPLEGDLPIDESPVISDINTSNLFTREHIDLSDDKHYTRRLLGDCRTPSRLENLLGLGHSYLPTVPDIGPSNTTGLEQQVRPSLSSQTQRQIGPANTTGIGQQIQPSLSDQAQLQITIPEDQSPVEPQSALQDQPRATMSKAPGKPIAQLSPTPPPKGKNVATMDDVLRELDDTTRALSEAAIGHTRAVMAAERLDAIACSQAEDLRGATKIIRLLMSKKPRLTKAEEQTVLNDFSAVKTRFQTVSAMRDGLRQDLAEHADADRIFGHDEQLDTPATTTIWARGISEAVDVEEVREWYRGQEWKRGNEARGDHEP